MHSGGRGISSSALPYSRNPPTYVLFFKHPNQAPPSARRPLIPRWTNADICRTGGSRPLPSRLSSRSYVISLGPTLDSRLVAWRGVDSCHPWPLNLSLPTTLPRKYITNTRLYSANSPRRVPVRLLPELSVSVYIGGRPLPFRVFEPLALEYPDEPPTFIPSSSYQI